MSPPTVIYLHEEVQKFLDQVGTVVYNAKAKCYVVNGNYYCATNEPNIFMIPNKKSDNENQNQRSNY